MAFRAVFQWAYGSVAWAGAAHFTFVLGWQPSDFTGRMRHRYEQCRGSAYPPPRRRLFPLLPRLVCAGHRGRCVCLVGRFGGMVWYCCGHSLQQHAAERALPAGGVCGQGRGPSLQEVFSWRPFSKATAAARCAAAALVPACRRRSCQAHARLPAHASPMRSAVGVCVCVSLLSVDNDMIWYDMLVPLRTC